MLCCHGQLEVIETSLFTTGPGIACQQLNEWLGEMNARHALGLNRAATLASVLADAGFAAITRTVRRLRIGKHAGLEGTCTRRYYLQRLALLHDQLTAVESGSDMDRFAQLLQNWDRECQTGQQVQLELYCYTARKLPPRSVVGHESSSTTAQPVSSTISTASSTLSSSVHSLVDLPRRHSTLGRRVKRGLASLRGTLRLSARDAPPTPRTIHRHHRSRLHLNSDKEQMR